MTRSKRRKIRRIALGLAVAALIVPATAQARPLDLSGKDYRVIEGKPVVIVAGAEDNAFSRQPASGSTTAKAERGDRYDAGVGSLGGLILILLAAGVVVAVHQSRKAKLSPA
jgi:hypothetical protein